MFSRQGLQFSLQHFTMESWKQEFDCLSTNSIARKLLNSIRNVSYLRMKMTQHAWLGDSLTQIYPHEKTVEDINRNAGKARVELERFRRHCRSSNKMSKVKFLRNLVVNRDMKAAGQYASRWKHNSHSRSWVLNLHSTVIWIRQFDSSFNANLTSGAGVGGSRIK